MRRMLKNVERKDGKEENDPVKNTTHFHFLSIADA